MNEKQYRKRVEAEVARSVRGGNQKKRARRTARGGKSNVEARIAKIDAMQIDATDGTSISRLIKTLEDPTEPKELRLAAFRALKTASFLGPAFAPYRAKYLKVLRAIATDDEPEIREEALETLVMEKVDFARRLLSEGLKKPEKALVTEAKAIQLLSYDGHAEVAPLVRKIFAKTSDLVAKEAALRFLSADPASAPLLSRVLKDRSQPARLRSLSAAGLRLANPKAFERTARAIVENGKEDDDVRATCLGALTLIKDYGKTRDDPSFAKAVASLKAPKYSRALRASARRFMSKLGK
jgi:HEAT repeat protein